MFQCKHKRTQRTMLVIEETGNIANNPDREAIILKPVFYCKDCRVLFLPIMEESVEINDKPWQC